MDKTKVQVTAKRNGKQSVKIERTQSDKEQQKSRQGKASVRVNKRATTVLQEKQVNSAA